MTAAPVVTGAATLDNSFLGSVMQVCVVTRDLHRTMRGMARTGIGPWQVHTFDKTTVQDLTLHGAPADYSMLLALAYSGTMMWEIVQPLTGDTIYHDFLARHDEGIHHVAVDCDGIPFEDRIRRFADHGYAMIQSGVWLGRVPYGYFATEADTGTILETFVIPEDLVFPEPDEWYPAPPPA